MQLKNTFKLDDCKTLTVLVTMEPVIYPVIYSARIERGCCKRWDEIHTPSAGEMINWLAPYRDDHTWIAEYIQWLATQSQCKLPARV